MHYLLLYDVVPEYGERRVAFRAAHLAHAWSAARRGELLLGGALAEPVDGAVLLFEPNNEIVPTTAGSPPYDQWFGGSDFRVPPRTTADFDIALTAL